MLDIKRLKFNHAGDTIIEVLLSIIVLGVVVTGAYVTSGRSATAIRASQERGEALKLAEGQMEHLRLETATSLPETPFCYNSVGDRVEPPCLFGHADRYQLSIEPQERHYLVIATWERVGGGQVSEQLDMVYRIKDQ